MGALHRPVEAAASHAWIQVSRFLLLIGWFFPRVGHRIRSAKRGSLRGWAVWGRGRCEEEEGIYLRSNGSSSQVVEIYIRTALYQGLAVAFAHCSSALCVDRGLCFVVARCAIATAQLFR